MKNIGVVFLMVFLFSSCIQYKTVQTIDNFRIESNQNGSGEHFVFKPEMTPAEAKYSLRKQFLLKDGQNLSSFETKLFKNLDLIFNVSISFRTDRNRYISFVPAIVGDGEPEDNEGVSQTFVTIRVEDSSGDNCLSTKSLFYNKTKSLLIDIKNNIREQDYFKPSITQ